MSGDVLGGGVVVALAAALWLAYLIPVWLRRREYLATERNAVRLQQTLRILAETSELPQAVRYEATARTVAEQQRILRKAEGRVKADARAAAEADARRERAVAEAQRAAAEEAERAALAAIEVERASRAAVAASARERNAAPRAARSVIAVSAQRRRRLRRVRASTSAILLAGLLGTIGGVTLLATGGTWMLLAASAAVAVASFGMLGRLARVRHRPEAARPVAVALVAAQLYDHADDDVAPEARPTWTPQPLPKPLHLSRGTIAASAMASIDAATELRRAAARAEIEERAARLASEVTALRPPVPVSIPAAAGTGHGSAGPSSPVPADPRFAAMGLVDDAVFSSIDLDAALRRRRAVG